jgi:hypothetical protein
MPYLFLTIVNIQGYWGNGNQLNNRQYIFGTPQGRYSTSHYPKYTLYLSQLLVSCTLAEHSQIHTISVDFDAHMPSAYVSRQYVWFIMAMYQIISSHPLSTLLQCEPIFIANGIRKSSEVHWSVDDVLSAF